MKHLYDRVRHAVRTHLSNSKTLKRSLRAVETDLAMLQHTAAIVFPSVIRPRPRKLIAALTAHCNLRCTGCRYGRDFMAGHQLPYQTVEQLLIDAENAGIETVRLYGGEPLLYPELPRVIRRFLPRSIGICDNERHITQAEDRPTLRRRSTEYHDWLLWNWRDIRPLRRQTRSL
jgi:sulfatase maturation enzyme AslB (radical SAM superfamily)